MPLLHVFDIAGSAMSANSIRLNVTSSNMANSESISSSTGEAYKERNVVFKTMMRNGMSNNGSLGTGVKVDSIVERDTSPRVRHQPNHPLADEKGNIYLPNINMVEQMAEMMSASRAYQSNVEVVNVAKQMLMGTLSIGQR